MSCNPSLKSIVTPLRLEMELAMSFSHGPLTHGGHSVCIFLNVLMPSASVTSACNEC